MSLSIAADLSKDFFLMYACSFRLFLPRWLCRFSYCRVTASAISVFGGKPICAAGALLGALGLVVLVHGTALAGLRAQLGASQSPAAAIITKKKRDVMGHSRLKG